jgi:integrase/recombinase XerD
LNESEIETILAGPDISGPIGLRDRALLEVLYSTGIRRMELIRLEIGDLNLERGVLLVRQGKGKKDRVVPVGSRALSWLHKYLTDARTEILIDSGVQALFVSGYGDGPMSAGYLTRLVTEYIRRAGVAKGGCHVFRHSCATLMLENGADIRFIQQILGHAHLTSTQIYTEVSIAQLQRVHAMTHPAEKPAALAPLPMPAAFNHPHAPRQTA